MGSSGHAFIAHTKALSPAAQPKDGGYGPPPHPVTVRSGQRYWPRAAHRREVLVVQRAERERIIMGRLDTRRALVRVTPARLLAVRPDGQGQHYQFQGFSPRRYATWAYVWSIDDREATLCLPEWHPRRAVHLPARLLPAEGRRVGAWLRARCDLSASSAGRLQVADLFAAAEPEAGSVMAPALAATIAGA
jgi:hypothetical protein